MASIEVPISDEKIITLLKEKYGLDFGKGRLQGIEVTREPQVSNSSISHIVSVRLDFGLELGEIEDLVGY
ncbi:hypothetical protein [Microbacterium murale]|uniref:Uncharacterized protein n=1 Tax=Microbacterium murale TaxID=1081040 RepID=A0ABU0PEU6_9MICO|nr:hypothetical protein [Microbacterium murale]MDQ0645537.1 hypothetical protein [Microbacterium murale]